jgi:hypothetical protein
MVLSLINSRNSRYAILVILGFLSLVSQTGNFQLQEIIALNGYSVLEVIAANKNAEGFVADFPGGSRVISSYTPLTWLHIFASQAGANSVLFLYFMISVEIVVYLFGIYIFWNAIFLKLSNVGAENTEVRRWSFVAVAALMLLSNSQMMNLGRFFAPYFHGQFYGFSDGLRLASIGYAVNKQWRSSVIFLSASFIIHPIKGLLGLLVVLTVFGFLTPKSKFIKDIKYFIIFMIFGLTWTIRTLHNTGNEIEPSKFIAWSRVFQVHWYPLDVGTFSSSQFAYFVPFAVITTAVLIGVVVLPIERRLQMALSCVVLLLILLTTLGIGISAFSNNQFLIKLTLTRASELLTLLACPLIFYIMVQFLILKRFGWVSFYLYLILIYFFPLSYYFLFSLVFMIIPLVLMLRERKETIAIITTVLWFLYFCIHMYGMIISTDWFRFLTGLGVNMIGTGLVFFCLSNLKQNVKISVYYATAIGMLIGGPLWAYSKVSSDLRPIDFRSDYLNTQDWARLNTSPTALFMVDPCINYGWRDFSERASIGTPREWFMTGWLYSGDLGALTMGEQISKTLGLNLDPEILGPQSSTKVCDLAREAFYHEEFKGLELISEAYKVSHFVLIKEEFFERVGSLPAKWKVSFENKTFFVIERVFPKS